MISLFKFVDMYECELTFVTSKNYSLRVLKRKSLLLAITFILVGVSIGAVNAAAPKTGAICTKLGMKLTYAGKTYTCIKSGKKLVWSKGVVIVKPSPSASPSPSPSSSPEPKESPAAQPTPKPSITPAIYSLTSQDQFNKSVDCKVSTKLSAAENYGFPRASSLIPTLGERRAIALFVYFDDLPFDPKQISEWENNQIPTFEKYIEAMSYGKLKYKIDLFRTPLHIKKSVLSYNLDTPHDKPMKPNADFAGLIRDAVAVADPLLDFSGFEFINVVTPATDKIGFEGAAGTEIRADGKLFTRATFGGIREYQDDPKKKIWLLHEVGHLMGLIHQFDVSADWGRSGFPMWSAMATGVSEMPEFIAWEKFLVGWFDENQIRCINSFELPEYTTQISSLSEMDSGVKTVMIRLGTSEILVVENRKSSDLGYLSKAEEGVFVYLIDANIESNKGAAKPIFNNPKTRMLSANRAVFPGTIQKGESVSYRGIKVEVLDSQTNGDIIRISKS